MDNLAIGMGNQMMLNNANLSINNMKDSAKNIQNASNSKETAKMEKAAEDFEAFFLSQMMEQMFQGVSTDGMFGGGHAEKVYRSMLVNEYGKHIAQSGGVGVADHVLDTMIEMQEKTSNQN